MRGALIFILFVSAFIATIDRARGNASDGSFDIGVWHGSPVVAEGSFAFCSMFVLFGRKAVPSVLVIAIDKKQGWTVAISSDEFKLPIGRIKAGLAFDDEAPVDVLGEIRSPTMISFGFPTTELLDHHVGARKLVLIFRDAVLPFALPRFAEAAQALRDCLRTNSVLATSSPATNQSVQTESVAQAPAVVPAPAAAANPAAVSLHLSSELVGLTIVGVVGSVLVFLGTVIVLFTIRRARMESRYFHLWSAEYRETSAAPGVVPAPERAERSQAGL